MIRTAGKRRNANTLKGSMKQRLRIDAMVLVRCWTDCRVSVRVNPGCASDFSLLVGRETGSSGVLLARVSGR